LVLLLPVRYQGVITMEEVRVTLTFRRLASLHNIQLEPHREHPVLVVKPAVCHRSIYLLRDGEYLNNTKNCGFFGGIADGEFSTHRDLKCGFTANHVHRVTESI